MKNHLLISAVAACLILPGAAIADPPAGPHRDVDRADKKGPPDGRGAEKGKPEAAPAPSRAEQDRHEPTRPEANSAGPNRSAASTEGPAPEARSERGRPSAPLPSTVERPPAQSQGQVQVQRPPLSRPQPVPSLGVWRAPSRGPARARAGEQWRQAHQNWDSGAAWRGSPDWWRQDSGFRLFVGPRAGYFFVPQRGYILAPRQYRNHHWREGEYLPRWFRAYTVSHYERYGLPRPPAGCVWVWLNGDVALIDRSDGYILDIARNAW